MIIEYDEEIEIVTPKTNQKLKLIGEIVQKTERNSPNYFTRKQYPYNDLFDKLYDRTFPELKGLLKLH